jgi:hypothetical protein
VQKFPTNIQIKFFKLLNNELSVEDFEQWVYKTTEIETHFDPADYIEFISLNFKARHFIHEMKKIVDKYLDYGEFEKRKIDKVLNDLINKTDDFAKSLIATYDLYCDGYGFLDNIGLGYGLTFANEFYEFADWTKLSSEHKNERIEATYDGVKFEAEKVRDWLEKKKVVLTGEVDDIGHFDYIDNRKTQEKKPTGYSVMNLDEQKSTTYNSTLPKAGPSWWQKLFGSE